MNSVMVSAPAKINWTLDILGSDGRGYHILDMLMQRITLYDALKIKKIESGIKISVSEKYIPVDEKNTAYRAANEFFTYTSVKGGAEIYIKKNIPSGAGLAGGSADAAAVLKGLDTLYETKLSEKELEELALKIGSDVPFMLKSGLYRASGTGEKLERLFAHKPIPLLCVMKKREPASTKLVYSLYDTLEKQAHPDTMGFAEALRSLDFEKMKLLGGNVLTPAAESIAPGISENILRMKKSAEYTAMTGSGSVVFGVFKTIEEAKHAEKSFTDVWSQTCFAADTGIFIKEYL